VASITGNPQLLGDLAHFSLDRPFSGAVELRATSRFLYPRSVSIFSRKMIPRRGPDAVTLEKGGYIQMPGPASLERHFTVTEICELWNMSNQFVHRIFKDEPGVIDFGKPTRLVGRGKYKRRYSVLRIPESVLQRVTERLMNKRTASSVPLDRGGRRDLHAS
jgi:hypothetical protein